MATTISWSDSMKTVFAALGAKTSDSNYAVPLLNKTSGTPQGMMDMSNLASVLGGITDAISSGQNVDDIKTIGAHTSNNSTTTASLTGTLPTGLNRGFIMFVLPNSQGGFRLQVIVTYDGSAAWIRAFQSNNWESWKTIYNQA